MVDLDQDGRRDVITGSWPGELYWFRGQADGSCAAAVQLKDAYDRVLNLGNASTVFAVDWEGDGDLDLLVGDIEGAVHLVPNESGGKALSFGLAQPVRVGGRPLSLDGDSAPILADWDGDGRRDLLSGSGQGRVIWCRDLAKEGAPLFGPSRELVAASSMWAADAKGPKTPWGVRTKPCVADWDGDGKVDLLVGDFGMVEVPAAELTAEGVARRDALQAELQKLSEEMGERWRACSARAGRELGLEVVDGEVQPPKEREQLMRFQLKTMELLEAERPGWQEAQRERMAAIQEELQPLMGESSPHGHVWFFRRR